MEVCLKIAVDTGARHEVAAALIALIDRAEAPDRALLDALLLLSTDRAEEGARRLGDLDDVRAVPVLINLAQTSPDDEVAIAAIRALAAYPSAMSTLQDWLVKRGRPLPLRIAIAAALGEARSPRAADILQDALRRKLPARLSGEIARTLPAYYPERVEPGELPPYTDGAPWMATAASFGLATTFGTAGRFSGLELWPVAGLTGGVAGASVGWLYGRAWPIEAGDAATIATMGIGGAASGTLIGAGLFRARLEAQPDLPLLFGLGGELVGFGVGYAINEIRTAETTATDALEAALLATAIAGSAELGLLVAADNGDRGPRALWTGASFAGGLLLGQVLSPKIDLRQHVSWVATGAGLGFASGFLIPMGRAERSLLPLATATGGAATGIVLSALEPPPGLLVGGITGATFGVGITAGLGLLIEPDPPNNLARGLGLGGAVVGAGIGTAFSHFDRDPVDDRDVAFAVAMGSWAAWNAYAVTESVGWTGARRVGLTALTTGTLATLASAMNITVDIPVPHTLSASSIGLWGGYAGAAIGELVDGDPFLLALVASDVSVLGGLVLVSPLIAAPPLVIGIADAGGVLGASIAGTTVGLATQDGQAAILSSLAGAGAGLAVGAIVGEWWRSSTQWERRDIARRMRARPGLGRRGVRPAVALSPLAVDRGGGVAVSVTRW